MSESGGWALSREKRALSERQFRRGVQPGWFLVLFTKGPLAVNEEREVCSQKSKNTFLHAHLLNLSIHYCHAPITAQPNALQIYIYIYTYTLYSALSIIDNFVLQIAAENTVTTWPLYSSVLPFFSTGLPKHLGLYYLLAFILNSNVPRYHLAENIVSMTLIPDRIYLFLWRFAYIIQRCVLQEIFRMEQKKQCFQREEVLSKANLEQVAQRKYRQWYKALHSESWKNLQCKQRF